MVNTACIQINSGSNMEANIRRACDLIGDAASKGAEFILLPENVALMSENRKQLFDNSPEESKHPALSAFREAAKNRNVWLVIGSLAVKAGNAGDRLRNRSYLIDNNGNIAGHYDKIHLYDVELENGEKYHESNNFAGGDKWSLLSTPWGKLGLTICYDVRFPHLYRTLAKNGAEFISIPSAFTEFTGKAHWNVLLRARAIENGCYVLAPAQTGKHPNNRETYGHAMIISPWGDVLSDAGEKEGFAFADIHPDIVRKIRKNLPSLQHDRDFSE